MTMQVLSDNELCEGARRLSWSCLLLFSLNLLFADDAAAVGIGVWRARAASVLKGVISETKLLGSSIQ
jgi:hypothetical protein